MSESNYNPTGQLQGDTSDLPDRGCSTGFLGTSHGVEFSPDSTQSLGGISEYTTSDPGNEFYASKGLEGEDLIPFMANTPDDQFDGVLGRIDGSSAEPGEENVNDADAGQPEERGYA